MYKGSNKWIGLWVKRSIKGEERIMGKQIDKGEKSINGLEDRCSDRVDSWLSDAVGYSILQCIGTVFKNNKNCYVAGI